MHRTPTRAADLSRQLGLQAVPLATAATYDVAVLAVKPQDSAQVLAALAPVLRPGTLVVSLCAGVATSHARSFQASRTVLIKLNGPRYQSITRHRLSKLRLTSDAVQESIGAVCRILQALPPAICRVLVATPASPNQSARTSATQAECQPREVAPRATAPSETGHPHRSRNQKDSAAGTSVDTPLSLTAAMQEEIFGPVLAITP